MRPVVLALIALPSGGAAVSQEASLRNADSHRDVTLAARQLENEITIDGQLDEPAWGDAEMATGFVQSYPRPGAPPSQRTEARVLFDERHLYIGVRAFDSMPELIAAPLARRDTREIQSDWLHIVIDSRLDGRTAFRFTVNPRGVQRDAYHFDDRSEDESWMAVWTVATQVDSLGWTAEFRIPLSQLRFGGDAADERTWGLQIMRDIAREDERSTWAPWSRTDPGFVSRFGLLTGLRGLHPPRGIELIPYLSGRVEQGPADPGNPFRRPIEPGGTAGLDLRVGLPAGLMLSATLNPDFGQVEADPAEVNLTAFETFLSERRPFFTEGSDVFHFGEPRAFSQYGFRQLFYSRRIGRAPQRQLTGPTYAHVDAPAQTNILGAAKVSGRTPDGWSVGLMNAVTGRERARFVGSDGAEQRTAVEPLSNYFVARLRRDLRDGGSAVGAILTSTYRSLDEPLEPLLHRNATVGGGDLVHTWASRAWRVTALAAGSRVVGEPAAIARSQRDPMRYLQRPDADYLRFDPDRSSLEGYIVETSLVHTGRWLGSLELKQVSPGFEINDVGFLSRADSRSVVAFLGQQVDRPRGILRNYSYWVSTFQAWNFGGDQILNGFSSNVEAGFANFWTAGLTGGYRPEYADDRLTRGGPLAAAPARWNMDGWLESDRRSSVWGRIFAAHRANVAGARERELGTLLEFRPRPALRVRAWPRITWNRSPAQYVATAPDPRAFATFGSRFVFADLDQTTASMEVRLDWTLSPTLSLQLFANPFISSGEFTRFKEFTKPGSFEFAVYGNDRGTICRYAGLHAVDPETFRSCPPAQPPPGDPDFTIRFGHPDFNIRSLRGNAVLRWEYRPGSTLFFVWQQDRSGFLPRGDFDLGRDVGAIFDAPAHHVFLIKASYWIGN